MTHQPPAPVTDLPGLFRAAVQQADLEAAVRLYESSGGVAGQWMLQDLSALTEPHKHFLARVLAASRDHARAAGVLELLAQHADAGEQYQHAGEFVLAARCFRAAGNLVAAGAALERAGKPDAALDLYRTAGAHQAMAQCLVREHRHFDAAALYRQLGDARAEAEMLYSVPAHGPQRAAAVLRLSELLEQFGHADQAIHLLGEAMAQNPGARADAAIHKRVLDLCDKRGHTELAARARAYIQQITSNTSGPPPAPLSQSAEMRAVLDPHNVQHADALQTRQSTPPPAPAPPELKTAMVDSVDPFDGLLVRTTGGGPTAEAFKYLKQVPLFAGLSFPDMQALYRACVHVSWPANAVVLEQGMVGTGLILVLQGSVTVLRVNNQVLTPLATLGPGEVLGEVSLLDAQPTSARVVALTAVRGLFISREAFQAFISTRDAAALQIFRVLSVTLAERLRASNLR